MKTSFKTVSDLKRQKVILILSLQIDYLNKLSSIEDYNKKVDRIQKAYNNTLDSWKRK